MTMRMDKKTREIIAYAMKNKITDEEIEMVVDKTNLMWEKEKKEREERWIKKIKKLPRRELFVYNYIEKCRHAYD